MLSTNPDLDLMHFIETNILPKYSEFGKSHGISHVQRVIKNSLKLAQITGADINMVYTIAAYHDIGMSGQRAIHHITGGKILAADQRLLRWFSPERELEPSVVFLRIIQFGLENYPEKDKEEQWRRFNEHLENKYSTAGYITLWIPNSPNEQYLKDLRNIMSDKVRLRKIFEEIYNQEK